MKRNIDYLNRCIKCYDWYLIKLKNPEYGTRNLGWNFMEHSLWNLDLIRFWCMSLKKLQCYSKFLISLTQWNRTKLRAIVPNRNYFKPIILKFKTFIYNSVSKIIYKFVRMGAFPLQSFLSLFPKMQDLL